MPMNSNSTGEWHQGISPEHTILDTKIDDEKGIRNEQQMIRKGNLWWYTDGSMYVYYRPTHWRKPA